MIIKVGKWKQAYQCDNCNKIHLRFIMHTVCVDCGENICWDCAIHEKNSLMTYCNKCVLKLKEN